jgi:hypothetical protein
MISYVSDPEPFYLPRPDLFGHEDAYRQFTTCRKRPGSPSAFLQIQSFDTQRLSWSPGDTSVGRPGGGVTDRGRDDCVNVFYAAGEIALMEQVARMTWAPRTEEFFVACGSSRILSLAVHSVRIAHLPRTRTLMARESSVVTWFTLIGPLVTFLGLGVAGTTVAFTSGGRLPGLGALLLFLSGLALALHRARKTVQRVTVSEEGLTGVTYGRERFALRWPEIRAVRNVSGPGAGKRMYIERSAGSTLLMRSQMSNFDDVRTAIEARAAVGAVSGAKAPRRQEARALYVFQFLVLGLAVAVFFIGTEGTRRVFVGICVILLALILAFGRRIV